MNNEYGWFNEKYGKREDRPSLDDIIELMSKFFHNFSIPERRAERLEIMLDTALNELKKEYTPVNEMIAHHLLVVSCSLVKMSNEKRREYLRQYINALDKHYGKTLFKPRT